MTAGDGVIHSEMPTQAFQARGGRMHGFQLWVNLPAADKRMRPRYQEKKASELPTATRADGQVWARVLAGEALGVRAAIDTRIPIVYVHLVLKPGAQHVQKIDPGFNVFAYVIAGTGLFGSGRTPGQAHDLVLFGDGGDELTLQNPAGASGPLDLLLIGGRPIGEPLARYGPFVMNTREEILEAVEDLHAGKFGTIAPELG
jgi:redox-sensitive bicupin YhaK (pirin superfamily)